MKQYKVCMSLAGSDPSGGAGIQADLKTFTLLGCYGQTVPTALTVQNSLGVRRSVPVDGELVFEQTDAVMSDLLPDAVKIGIVPNASVAGALVRVLGKYCPHFVVYDPVFVSSSGLMLVNDEAREIIIRQLFPLCSLITPNIPEARMLCSDNKGGMSQETLAERVSEMAGGVSVLVKGGHRTDEPVDVLFHKGTWYSFPGHTVNTPHTHGTGCVLSSAIAAFVAHGFDVPQAVKCGKDFLTQALERGNAYFAGQGHGAMYLVGNADFEDALTSCP